MRYRVSQAVLDAVVERPELAVAPAIRRLRLNDTSDLEVVRVLGAVHLSHIAVLLDLIDTHLPVAGDISRKLLQARDPEAFEHAVAELLLFIHLRKHLGDAVKPVPESCPGPTPDLEVSWKGLTVRLEVYSPSDFTGNQRFERQLASRLQRLDVSFGYTLSARVVVPDDPANPGGHLWYAYDMPHESVVPAWAKGFSAEAAKWLATASAGEQRSFAGPAQRVYVELTLEGRTDAGGDRSVTICHPTKSTDTELFFDCGTAEDTARGPWGNKIRAKLEKRQAGGASNSTLRGLVVNFAPADAADRDFFCKADVAQRIEATARLLIGEGEPAYDFLLPAHLGLETGFGRPAVLDETRRAAIEDFVATAGLGLPVAPYVGEDGADSIGRRAVENEQ